MNLTIKQTPTLTENLSSSSIVETLYQLTKPDPSTGLPSADAILVGRIQVPAAYEDAVNFLNTQFSAANSDNGSDFQVTVLNNNYYIRFADPNIVDFLVSKGVMQAGQGLTIEQAKTATLGQGVGSVSLFKNSGVLSFDEFKYFTKFNTERYDMLFRECSLESVDLTNVKEAWWLQFGWAPNLKYFNGRDSEEGSLSLPHFETFRSIQAFAGDTGIKKLLSLGTCTILGMGTFDGCTNLTTIHQNICNKLTIIKEKDFNNCPIANFIQNDETVTNVLSLPNLITLGNKAFARNGTNTTSFTEITSLGVVSVIGEYAFKNCTNLLTINFPNTISEIGIGAFDGTAWLAAQNNGPIYIAKVLYKCKNVSGALVIPDNKTSITAGAFHDCSNLTSVTIGSGVASIGINEGVFKGCSTLATIVVDSNNTEYDSRDNCNAIIETTTNKLIAGCKASTIPNTVITIGNYAFKEVDITSVTIPNSVTSLGTRCFYGCKGLTSAAIPASIVTFGEKTFEQCTGLASVTLENGLQSLAKFMFQGCSSLTSIVIPNSVISFNDGGTFLACSSLSSITLPDNMTSIPWCFLEGTAITSLTVPAGVTTIGSRAINACQQLRTLTMLPTTPPTLVASDSLKNFHADLLIYVPSGSVDAYKTANGWKDIPNINNRVLAIT